MISRERLMEINVAFYRHKDAFRELVESYTELRDDMTKALELLDSAGVWTGADNLLHDRIQQLINDRNGYERLYREAVGKNDR